MDTKKEVRLLGLEGKNEFLDIFNVLSYKYSDILDKLGYSDLDNLVEIVRNKIYDMAEKYEVESEYFFYCSLSGDIIVQMFEHILKKEYDKLVQAYKKLENSSVIGRFLYYSRSNNWIVEYENLCAFCKKFQISQLKEEFFSAFFEAIDKEPFLSRKDAYINSFKLEVEYLTGNDELSGELDKCLVKSIGSKI